MSCSDLWRHATACSGTATDVGTSRAMGGDASVSCRE